MSIFVKKFSALAIVAAATLSLGACAVAEGEQAPSGSDGIVYVEVDTPRGSVPCLVTEDYRQGGLSCDWSSSRAR